ncbi:unnamed protein product [Ceutorhynchus assimilis]|uniref:lysoplasmalogenase n=1 Tax=Ceutorhynchus assimilis TaxID=467358 RepID=A0A9P0DMH5_9CUCU|nr:unnamed protein product [Ceutorhynchus assimilis]
MNLPQISVLFGKLVPFFATVIIYFILLIPPAENPTLLAVIIKCSPIMSLMYFVKHYGSCTNPIFVGLFFCCIGDGFLMFKGYFFHGMLAFMLGHLNYIRAFGFKPLKPRIGLFSFLIGGINISLLYKGLSGLFVPGVSMYILIIDTMIWRAFARLQNPWTWTQISICTGSVLFALSDFFIGISMFVRPIAHSQVLIMSSYYAAQLGISLGVLEIVPK